MFISSGGRLLAALACTGAAVLAGTGLLTLALGFERASLWVFLLGPLAALAVYAAALALLPEVAADEEDA